MISLWFQETVPDDNIDLLLENLEQPNGLSLQNDDCGGFDRRSVLHVEHRWGGWSLCIQNKLVQVKPFFFFTKETWHTLIEVDFYSIIYLYTNLLCNVLLFKQHTFNQLLYKLYLNFSHLDVFFSTLYFNDYIFFQFIKMLLVNVIKTDRKTLPWTAAREIFFGRETPWSLLRVKWKILQVVEC